MQSAQYSGWQVETALVWFRRDLRTYDNPALVAALQAAKNVIPVFIWAPEEEGQFQPGALRSKRGCSLCWPQRGAPSSRCSRDAVSHQIASDTPHV